MSTKRSHSKSRLGCKQCKTRRIKCDETPPRCENCTKRGLECDYQGWESAFKNIRFFTPPILPERNPPLALDEPAKPSTDPIVPPTFTLDDMGLFCHFILHTAQTMDFVGETTVAIWQRDVPQLAKSHPFLMHAVLAFAAVHQAKTEESQSSQSLELAHHHYDQALKLFRQSVSQITGNQADVFLTFGILNNFLNVSLDFERPTDQQHPIDVFAQFFTMLHNFFGMMSPVSNSLQASAIATQLRHANNVLVPHDIPPTVDAALNRLTELVLLRYPNWSTDSGEALLINQTLANLRELYTFVDPYPQVWNSILRWPAHLDTGFADLLKSRNPIALCVLAYWCVPLHNAPTRWYFGDRPRSLMLAIARELHGTEWAEGMRWPLSETVGDVNFDR